MNFASKKRLVVTPIAKDHFLASMYQKLEASRLPPPEVDLETDITFFGNSPHTAVKLGYDQFFSYTKTFPLYDKRKAWENRGFMPDKWRNIHQQEQPPKAIPATTSQWYGRRPSYDPDTIQFGRKHQTGSFFARQGALRTDPMIKYTEEVIDMRI